MTKSSYAALVLMVTTAVCVADAGSSPPHHHKWFKTFTRTQQSNIAPPDIVAAKHFDVAQAHHQQQLLQSSKLFSNHANHNLNSLHRLPYAAAATLKPNNPANELTNTQNNQETDSELEESEGAAGNALEVTPLDTGESDDRYEAFVTDVRSHGGVERVIMTPIVADASLDTVLTEPLIRVKRVIDSDDQHKKGRTGRGRPISKDDLEKSGRAGSEPDIDDIIQGIMQLLGGNVKIDAASSTETPLTTFTSDPSQMSTTRKNDRGPPRLPINPFNFFNGNRRTRTRPPIRPPITTPVANGPAQGRPSFVANTLPPFYATLPPALDRPRPQLTAPHPPVSGYPLPVNLLPQSSMNEVTEMTEPGSGDDENSSSAPVTPSEEQTPPISTPELNPTEASGSESVNEGTPISETTIELQTTAEGNESVYASEIPSSEIFLPDLSESSIHSSTPESALTPTATFDSSSLISTTSVAPASSSHHTPALPSSSTESIPTIIGTGATTAPTLTSSISTITSSSSSYFTAPLPVLPSSSPSASSVASPVKSSSQLLAPYKPLPPPVAAPVPTRFPRPGVVLDAEYPVQVITSRPVPAVGDVFDVTVSAHQGFGAAPPPILRPSYNNRPLPMQGVNDLLVTPAAGTDGYVSIDGRKTYFNLVEPTRPYTPPRQTMGTGVGVVIPEEELEDHQAPALSPVQPPAEAAFSQTPPYSVPPVAQQSTSSSTSRRTAAPLTRRPTQPSIRIDTCIVGDDSTCQEQLGEVCRTVGDVSSCYCRPGTERKRPRTKCKKLALLEMSLKVDMLGGRRLLWGSSYGNPESEEYRSLLWEATHAIDDAFARSGLSGMYLGNTIEKFYSLGGKVIVNSTVKLESNPNTRNRNFKRTLQRHFIKVIQDHGNNIGNSALRVEGPLNPVPVVDDVNECSVLELNNCHEHAVCVNEFSTFTCRCLKGYTDRYDSDPEKVGRYCETCSSEYCSKRGQCNIENGEKVCKCIGSYYGDRCEVDGEVVGVAVGASVAAVIIIILTLLFLCMWSRRWRTEEQKTEALRRGGLFARAAAGGGHFLQQKFGMAPAPAPAPPAGQYGATLEDHIRWAQMNEAAMVAAQQSVYGTYLPPPLPRSKYMRVTRTLSNTPSRLFTRIKRLFLPSSGPYNNAGSYPNDLSSFVHGNNTLPQRTTLQQLIALQTRLNEGQYAGPPTLYKQHLQADPGYGSLYAGSSQYAQHLNPAMLPVPSIAPSLMSHLTRTQYGAGPTSLIMPMSHSRAPTEVHHSGGDTMSSEEEDLRKHQSAYHLPRPKSRAASVGDDSSDLYYELDAMGGTVKCSSQRDSSRIPYPSKPPPPLPRHIFS